MKTREIVLNGKPRVLVSYNDKDREAGYHPYSAVIWYGTGTAADYRWRVNGVMHVLGKVKSSGMWVLHPHGDRRGDPDIELGRTLVEAWAKMRLLYDGH